MSLPFFDETKPATGSGVSSADLRNNFNALYKGEFEYLKVTAQEIPDLTVRVAPAVLEGFHAHIWIEDSFLDFEGGSITDISLPSTYDRISMVCIDKEGTLFWVHGIEDEDSPEPPDVPENKIPLALIYCRPGMTKIVNRDYREVYPTQGYIYKDIRPFVQKVIIPNVNPIKEITEDYTFEFSDIGKIININGTTDLTLTIPGITDGYFREGSSFEIRNESSYEVYLAGETNVVLQSYDGLTIANIFEHRRITHIDNDGTTTIWWIRK